MAAGGEGIVPARFVFTGVRGGTAAKVLEQMAGRLASEGAVPDAAVCAGAPAGLRAAHTPIAVAEVLREAEARLMVSSR